MQIFLNKIYEQYHEIWDSRGIVQLVSKKLEFLEFFLNLTENEYCFPDTRLKHMPFINSPLPILLVVCTYLLIVGTGKKWMKHRQPLQIDRIIIAYNSVQIIANSVVFVMVGSFV